MKLHVARACAQCGPITVEAEIPPAVRMSKAKPDD
jgi:hypothetical protein